MGGEGERVARVAPLYRMVRLDEVTSRAVKARPLCEAHMAALLFAGLWGKAEMSSHFCTFRLRPVDGAKG